MWYCMKLPGIAWNWTLLHCLELWSCVDTTEVIVSDWCDTGDRPNENLKKFGTVCNLFCALARPEKKQLMATSAYLLIAGLRRHCNRVDVGAAVPAPIPETLVSEDCWG